MRKPWTNRKLLSVARRLDDLNGKVEDLVRQIDESRHPLGAVIAQDLKSLTMLDSAVAIVEDFLSDAERIGGSDV